MMYQSVSATGGSGSVAGWRPASPRSRRRAPARGPAPGAPLEAEEGVGVGHGGRHRPAAGVAQHVGVGLAAVAGIERHPDEVGGGEPEVGVGRREAVVLQHADPVPGPQTQRQQPVGQPQAPLPGLGERQPGVAVDDGLLIGVETGRAAHQRPDVHSSPFPVRERVPAMEARMHPASDVTSFGRVDDQSDPDYFVRFVDEANAMPAVEQLEEMAIPELRLEPGMRVLDLGCGTGEDSRRLAGLVGPAGEVVGVDASETMIAAARQRTEGTGLPVEFHVGDAMRLDLPTESFDAVRCERMLVHVPEPAVVLTEMARVTRAGGRVVVIDIDIDGTILDLPGLDRDFLRRTVHAMSDALSAGQIGRQLPAVPGGEAGRRHLPHEVPRLPLRLRPALPRLARRRGGGRLHHGGGSRHRGGGHGPGRAGGRALRRRAVLHRERHEALTPPESEPAAPLMTGGRRPSPRRTRRRSPRRPRPAAPAAAAGSPAGPPDGWRPAPGTRWTPAPGWPGARPTAGAGRSACSRSGVHRRGTLATPVAGSPVSD